MKSEYFELLPNDIRCSLQSFAAIALKTKKLWRKRRNSTMAWVSPFKECGDQLLIIIFGVWDVTVFVGHDKYKH